MRENIIFNNSTLVLDIGTSKITGILPVVDEYGKVTIQAYYTVENHNGLKNGIVINIDKTTNAILKVMENIEAELDNVQISNAIVNISGVNIKKFVKSTYLNKADSTGGFTMDHIETMLKDILNQPLPPENKVLHVFNQEFHLENDTIVQDPVGMVGERIDSDFLLITGSINNIRNIKTCLERANLKMLKAIYSGIGSAEAVLDDDDKVAGTCVIDLGGGTTDMVIYEDGLLRHVAVFPIGGEQIIKDLALGCTISSQDAANQLRLNGQALKEDNFRNENILIKTLNGKDNKYIIKSNIIDIITFRLVDILDLIRQELKSSKYESKITNIVLVGGLSNMKAITEIFETYLGIHTRVGDMRNILATGYKKSISNPSMAAVVGSFLHLKKTMELVPQTPKDELVAVEAPIMETQATNMSQNNINTDAEYVSPKKKFGGFFSNIHKNVSNFFEENDQNI